MKSAVQSTGFDLFVWLVHQFHMPLFFVLAGWALERSLRIRSPAEVRRERYARLLVPFLAGVVLVSPPQAYIEAITQKGFTGGFAAFLPHFFTSLEYFSWHHLWFLIYLFVFTMLYLRVLARLERAPLRIEAVPPTHLYLAILPFAVVQLGLRWRWPGFQNLYDDWANFAWYSLFFVAGFVVARVPPVDAMLRRERRRAAVAFALAVVAMLPLLARTSGRVTEVGPAYFAYWPLSAAAGVCGVAAILGYGAALASVEGRALPYLREAALPIYILHQGVIVLLAYYVVGAPGPLVPRYLGLLVGSVVVALGVYHLAVRPSRPLRVLFGMARVTVRPPAQAAAPESSA